MATGAPSWYGQAPIPGLKVIEQQYRGADGGYRPYRYDVSGLRRASGWDGYEGPNGVRLDSKGRVVGQWYEGGAERTVRGGTSGAGGAAGSPGGQPIPDGTLAAQAALLARTKYQQRLNSINQRRQTTLRGAGYLGDIDANTGQLSNVRTDPYNQYGAFQMLNRAQAINAQSIQDENIGRGLGTGGGLAAQNLAEGKFQWGQQDAELGSQLTDALSGLADEQLGAQQEMNAALYQAQLDALREAIQNGDFYPVDGGGDYGTGEAPPGGTGGGGAGSKPKPKPKPRKPVIKASNPYATGQNRKPRILPKPKASNPYATGQNKKGGKR